MQTLEGLDLVFFLWPMLSPFIFQVFKSHVDLPSLTTDARNLSRRLKASELVNLATGEPVYRSTGHLRNNVCSGRSTW